MKENSEKEEQLSKEEILARSRRENEKNGDEREQILANAPARKDGSFKVPRTVE